MRRITDRQELLDGPLDDGRLLRGTLRDLRRINRHLGGARLSAMALESLVGHGPSTDGGAGEHGSVSLLDVGTGAADIPVDLIRQGRRGRVDGAPSIDRWLRVTGIDERDEVLEAARAIDPAVAGLLSSGQLVLQTADGRALPYADGAFDVAHTSLVIHHLAPAEAVTLLREMARVARRGVIVNDLLRSRRSWLGAWLLTRLITRNPYTRHDGPLSVRRAYTRRELRRMLEAAGLVVAWEGTDPLRHRWAAAARRLEP